MDALPTNETWQEIADHHLDHDAIPEMLAYGSLAFPRPDGPFPAGGPRVRPPALWIR
jgi:hypothetical protein